MENDILIFQDFEEWGMGFAANKRLSVTFNNQQLPSKFCVLKHIIKLSTGYLVGLVEEETDMLELYPLDSIHISIPENSAARQQISALPGTKEEEPIGYREQEWVSKMISIASKICSYDKEKYPTLNHVLKEVYTELRDVYGVVMAQLRKEYKTEHETDRAPDPIYLIQNDDCLREIFENLLTDLCDGYERPSATPASEMNRKEMAEEARLLAWELGEKRGDTSKGYNATFRLIYENMECNWERLGEIHQRKANSKEMPRKFNIMIANPWVFSEFRSVANTLLTK